MSRIYRDKDFYDSFVDFVEPGLPKTVDEYFSFIEKEFDFLTKRNQRIAKMARI